MGATHPLIADAPCATSGNSSAPRAVASAAITAASSEPDAFRNSRQASPLALRRMIEFASDVPTRIAG